MFKKPWFPLLLSAFIVLIAAVTIASFLIRAAPANTPSPISPAAHCGTSQPGSATTVPAACRNRILVFSKTAAFRHASIVDGKQALKNLADQHGFAIDFSEDSSVFTDSNLARYSAVVFLMTTGNIVNASQKAAFQRYIEAGGGFVGVHSASDTEYDWSWYDGLVGAHNNVADKHSSVQPAVVRVEDPNTPSTDMLPSAWMRTDEWYNFAVNPRGRVHVLLTVDERTYKGGIMGADHPIAWYHEYDGGRSWYTAMGHTSQTYHEPLFLAHLWGGVEYAAGLWPQSAIKPTSSLHRPPDPVIDAGYTADVKYAIPCGRPVSCSQLLYRPEVGRMGN